MKVIRPVTVTSAILTTNVPETLPVWSDLTDYAAGAQVRSTATNRTYESIAGGNLNNAVTDTSKWLDLGPTNAFAMFDQSNGTAAVAPNIDVTLAITGRSDGLALLGVNAQSVQVTVTSSGGATLYDQTISLRSKLGINSWYAYLTEEITFQTDLILTGLPLDSTKTIRIQITGPVDGTTVSVGNLVVGQVWDIGVTIKPAKAGIKDYSRVEADTYGNYTVVRRAFSRSQSFKVAVDLDRVDLTYKRLADYRAVPLVWIGSDIYGAFSSFGFVGEWFIDLDNGADAILSLESKGLT